VSAHIRGRAEGVASVDLAKGEGLTLKQRVELVERRILMDSLKRHEGNKTRTAKALGLSRYGFLKKLDKYRLRGGDPEGEPVEGEPGD
jgi:DNA-binding NtrC family response regulator